MPFLLLAGIADDLARSDQLRVLREYAPREGRASARLLAADAYDAWALWWPAGSNVDPHDHGPSRGLFTVVSGEVTEVRWAGGRRLTRNLGAGQRSFLPQGLVHDVVGTSSEVAVSVHVYSPPLTEMRYYDDRGAEVVGVEVVPAGVAEEPQLVARPVHAGGL